MNNIKNVQTLLTRAQVIIEVESAELVEQLVSQHNLKHTIEHENKEYNIPLFPADNAIEVKVSDLPPHMPNTLIAKHFSPYGEVLSVTHETWKEYFPGLPNCVRILRMRLRKAIPSFVAVDGEMSYVIYRNQIRTCRHCGYTLHMGQSCADARKEHSRSVNERLTTAQIVEGTMAPTVSTAQLGQTTSSSEIFTTPSHLNESSATSQQKASTTQPNPVIDRRPPILSSSLAASNRSSSTSRIPHNSQVTAPSKTDLLSFARGLETSATSDEFVISDEEMTSNSIASHSKTKRPGSPQVPDNTASAKRTTRSKK